MDNVYLENLNSNKKLEKVITVGTNIGAYPHSLETSMKELAELVYADGAEVVGEVTQNIYKFNPKYLIGSGKVDEIKEMVELLEVDAVVFNDELSGIQVRNLEKRIKKKVIDRTNLILDIFGLRATTYEAKLQVELARLEYQLPRLLGIDGWSRTGGGIGTRGPGEQIIETDRRRLKREIDKIKEKLEKAKRTRDTTRERRIDSNIPIVSLVGYTNAGKSTILNRLKDEESGEVSVKNMLFETLDPSSRKARLLSGREFIISDTVGFVSKLPTKIVEAFKSTLEEIKYSDLILHVIDASSEDLEIQYNTTMAILKDIEVLDKNIITVFNKVDRVDLYDINLPLRVMPDKKVYISALKDENMDSLLKIIEDNLDEKYFDVKLKFAYNDTDLLYKLVEKFDAKPIYEEDGIYLDLKLEEREYEKVKDYVVNV
ncbi:MAG: GTPase HflX [Peptoniphilus harei]|uniref:GTPase HflX n=1 Tax=Peptoniphilus harei ACS-146-V-Sch2b TaxID=908338 RepID=E4KY18_9FIRM|nr:GTPase HflX [Peptoniphilus harei]EFR33173.1 GTP-binding protein HflX [Peptoniphilus harei ACS-146-V-Sch2b]MDK7756002.1 GTPase HflX [Peptoniphilus harei]MDK7761768.1 GTPase HflX [Peptoniphilus harei]MDK8271426.1 GTPase HflX [Peptoniphilus harei]MDK8339914.1 GTPase HflX [Peptoniphilus harei]